MRSTTTAYVSGKPVNKAYPVAYPIEEYPELSALDAHGARKPLPMIVDDRTLANHLEASLSAIWSMIIAKKKQYTKFFLRRNGKSRMIHRPSKTLSYIQYMLLHKVYDLLPYSNHVIAYVPGKSCRDGAAQHTRKKIVLSMDISNFFTSVKRAQVRNALSNYYPRHVAHLMAELSTCENFVPQGAATSGAVANLVAQHTFDQDIQGRLPAWTYTRYSDDMTFSTVHEVSAENITRTTKTVERCLKKYGFQVNSKKTRWVRAPKRQVVLGLQVNDGVCLPRRKYHEIRAQFNKAADQGIVTMAKEQGKEPWQVEGYLRGLLSYVNSVDQKRFQLLFPVWSRVAGKGAAKPNSEPAQEPAPF